MVNLAKGIEDAIFPFVNFVKEVIDARPASALLLNSMRRATLNLLELVEKNDQLPYIKESFSKFIEKLVGEIKEVNSIVARIASRRVMDGDVIMTSSYSTVVMEALKNAIKEGKNITVYVPESRPRSEGLVLAKKLADMGVNTILFVDSAVRYMMKDVDKVLTSSEAIAANGAVINKVGTSQIALAAHEARVRFFVLSATSKFNPETLLGEVVELAKVRLELGPEIRDLKGIKALSPLFDVTPPEYVDAIITEKGLIAPQAVAMVVREIYGWPPGIPPISKELNRLASLAKKSTK